MSTYAYRRKKAGSGEAVSAAAAAVTPTPLLSSEPSRLSFPLSIDKSSRELLPIPLLPTAGGRVAADEELLLPPPGDPNNTMPPPPAAAAASQHHQPQPPSSSSTIAAASGDDDGRRSATLEPTAASPAAAVRQSGVAAAVERGGGAYGELMFLESTARPAPRAAEAVTDLKQQATSSFKHTTTTTTTAVAMDGGVNQSTAAGNSSPPPKTTSPTSSLRLFPHFTCSEEAYGHREAEERDSSRGYPMKSTHPAHPSLRPLDWQLMARSGDGGYDDDDDDEEYTSGSETSFSLHDEDGQRMEAAMAKVEAAMALQAQRLLDHLEEFTEVQQQRVKRRVLWRWSCRMLSKRLSARGTGSATRRSRGEETETPRGERTASVTAVFSMAHGTSADVAADADGNAKGDGTPSSSLAARPLHAAPERAEPQPKEDDVQDSRLMQRVSESIWYEPSVQRLLRKLSPQALKCVSRAFRVKRQSERRETSRKTKRSTSSHHHHHSVPSGVPDAMRRVRRSHHRLQAKLRVPEGQTNGTEEPQRRRSDCHHHRHQQQRRRGKEYPDSTTTHSSSSSSSSTTTTTTTTTHDEESSIDRVAFQRCLFPHTFRALDDLAKSSKAMKAAQEQQQEQRAAAAAAPTTNTTTAYHFYQPPPPPPPIAASAAAPAAANNAAAAAGGGGLRCSSSSFVSTSQPPPDVKLTRPVAERAREVAQEEDALGGDGSVSRGRSPPFRDVAGTRLSHASVPLQHDCGLYRYDPVTRCFYPAQANEADEEVTCGGDPRRSRQQPTVPVQLLPQQHHAPHYPTLTTSKGPRCTGTNWSTENYVKRTKRTHPQRAGSRSAAGGCRECCGRLNPYCRTCRSRYRYVLVDPQERRPVCVFPEREEGAAPPRSPRQRGGRTAIHRRRPSPREACRYHGTYLFSTAGDDGDEAMDAAASSKCHHHRHRQLTAGGGMPAAASSSCDSSTSALLSHITQLRRELMVTAGEQSSDRQEDGIQGEGVNRIPRDKDARRVKGSFVPATFLQADGRCLSIDEDVAAQEHRSYQQQREQQLYYDYYPPRNTTTPSRRKGGETRHHTPEAVGRFFSTHRTFRSD